MSAPPGSGPVAHPSRVLVLVVDDEEHARDVISLALEFAGFEVLVAADGREGLRQTLECAPDVVLTDIHMPRMDGDELACEIIDRLGPDAPPIVAFTADRDAVESLKERHEFRAVVGKPVSPSQLIALVQSCLPSSDGPGV